MGYYNGQETAAMGIIRRKNGVTFNLNASTNGVVGIGVSWSLE